jgi:hypothetical protein
MVKGLNLGNHLLQTLTKANLPMMQQALDTTALMLGIQRARKWSRLSPTRRNSSLPSCRDGTKKRYKEKIADQ